MEKIVTFTESHIPFITFEHIIKKKTSVQSWEQVWKFFHQVILSSGLAVLVVDGGIIDVTGMEQFLSTKSGQLQTFNSWSNQSEKNCNPFSSITS